MDDLYVDGLSTWVPLDLDAPASDNAEQLMQHFGTDEATATAAAGIGGIAAQLGQDDTDGTVTLAAWVRTLSDDELIPLEIAALRGVAHAGDDVSELAELLAAGDPPHGSTERGEIDTASGPAHTLRWRSVVTGTVDREIHEDNAVVWLRPDRGYAVVLSCHSVDLVSAVSLPGALHQLAAGVHGL
ncbi:hypothetical protein [Nocardioides donggukensis]|uniref:Uncharacterized protein n=1 Tax=Nocardioides donggukensis TaxID=2774019 RepID=A0A927K4S7_9ACTN|nr:hypothetical protein [Nocardioides donggukensis]MBD8870504.1 hypothetical protein [Nocardioides donggukensis]